MKLYTRTVCPKCLWIKSEAQRVGAEVEIINIDHEEEARRRLMDAGIRSVPVMETDGRFLVDPLEMVRQLERCLV
jgi:glutaredoxin